MRKLLIVAAMSVPAILLAGCTEDSPTAAGDLPLEPQFLITSSSSGFSEDFSSPTLDPAWTVLPGIRGGSGFPPPANHHSLTDRPGFLRYYLDPMTHFDGFWNGYQPTFGEHSCCTHDPGLELHRPLTGDHWLFEARADFHIPFTNGRRLDLRVYFGSGGTGTIGAALARGRDVNSNYVAGTLHRQDGATVSSLTLLEAASQSFGLSGTADDSYYYRLERAAGVLTALWSTNAINWNVFWTHDFGSGLDGLQQRVVITGLSWFNTGGSYADWDYINVTPTIIPVAIDVQPGIGVGTIKLGTKGTTPVAILSAADFDAPSEVDRASLTFGRTGDEASLAFCSTTPKDVNLDGLLDLVCHFTTSLTGFQVGDTEGVLKGETVGGTAIEGRDAVRII